MRRARSSSSPGPSFDDLIAAATKGQRAAIAELYRRFNPQLVRFLEGRAPGAGGDLAQDTWETACASLVSFSGDERQFRAWLFTVARRRLIDDWRRTARRPVSAGPMPLEHLADSRHHEDGLEAQDAVAQIVRHLTPEQADIVLLRVVADLSAEEVAAIVGKSPGAVRVAQHRALRTLAAALGVDPVTQ